MRLRRLLRTLLTLLLVVSLLPGVPELVENLEHLVHDGHLPHSAQHDTEKYAEQHTEDDTDEHGCSPMAHHCACHVSVVGLPVTDAFRLGMIEQPEEDERRSIGITRQPRSRANGPPTPPPIA